jgi:hypothetical protein
VTIEQRIWEWMPARRTRARVTSHAVAAANHWRLAVDVHQANHETTYMRLHDGDLPELLAPDVAAALGIGGGS